MSFKIRSTGRCGHGLARLGVDGRYESCKLQLNMQFLCVIDEQKKQ